MNDVETTQQNNQLPAGLNTRKELTNDPINAFGSLSGFDSALRIARMLSGSAMVPKDFQGEAGLPNCVIALEMANRLGASVLAVMQSIYMVHGKPGWSAQYVIAAVNSSGKFKPLRFDVDGDGDARTCVAWTTDKDGQRLESPPVSIAMAKAEGWYSKNGSKWQTMPELMLRYRAATFFGRLYAPELMMGMRTNDELEDLNVIDANGNVIEERTSASTADLNATLRAEADQRQAQQQSQDAEKQAEKPADDKPAGKHPEAQPAPKEAPERMTLAQFTEKVNAAQDKDALDLALSLATNEETGIKNPSHRELAQKAYDDRLAVLEGGQ